MRADNGRRYLPGAGSGAERRPTNTLAKLRASCQRIPGSRPWSATYHAASRSPVSPTVRTHPDKAAASLRLTLGLVLSLRARRYGQRLTICTCKPFLQIGWKRNSGSAAISTAQFRSDATTHFSSRRDLAQHIVTVGCSCM